MAQCAQGRFDQRQSFALRAHPSLGEAADGEEHVEGCRAAAGSYAVPGRLVGLSALKANAAAAPPSNSATM